MPRPQKNSTDDYLFYSIADKITPKLCGLISPNAITLLGFIPTFMLMKNFYYSKGLIDFGVWMWLYYFLDCLDGQLARDCNQTTIHGAFLDEICDLIKFSLLVSVFVWKKTNNKGLIFYLSLFSLIITLLFHIPQLYNKIKYWNHKELSNTKFSKNIKMCLDNGGIILFLFFLFLKMF